MTLLLGGAGQLGTALRVELPDADTPTSRELNLLDPGLAGKVIARKPDCIINCAAYTDVDGAENDAAQAMLSNATAVGTLAATAGELNVPFVTFSTDYIFDGKARVPYDEQSRPNPINAYGQSKLAGEHLALRHSTTLVIRTSWLLSATHPNFLSRILAAGLRGAVAVVDDQVGTPTAVGDLATAVVLALQHGVRGVLHVAGAPPVSRYELAIAAFKAAHMDPANLYRSTSAEVGGAAQRPANSALASRRTAEPGVGPAPSWEVRLPEIAKAIMATYRE